MRNIESRLEKLENKIFGTIFETFELPYEATEDDEQYLLQKRYKGAEPPKNVLIVFITNFSSEFKDEFYKEKALFMGAV